MAYPEEYNLANTNDELSRLRAEARKRHQAATKKISRINRNDYMQVSGTHYDPRRNLANVTKRYNKAQLQAYINQLNEFNSRSTSFVRGSEGVVMNGNRWRYYKNLEKRYNAIGKKHESGIGGIKLPTSNMTIAQREATFMNKNFVRPGVTPTQRPFNQLNRESTFVKGDKALDKLIKQMEKKVAPQYLEKTLKAQKKQLREALKTIGDKELTKMANSLSDEQFNVVWNYSNFATQIGAMYFVQKSRATSNNEKRWYASVYEDYINDAKEILEWAGSVNRGEYTDTRARAINTVFNPNDTTARTIPVQSANPAGARQARSARGRRRGL